MKFSFSAYRIVLTLLRYCIKFLIVIEPLSIPSSSATQEETADSGVSISPRAGMELLRQVLRRDNPQEWSALRERLKTTVRALNREIHFLRKKWIAHGDGENVSAADTAKLLKQTKAFLIKAGPRMAEYIDDLVDQLPTQLPNPQQSTSSPLPQPGEVPSQPPYSISLGSRPLVDLQLSLGLPSFFNWLRRLQTRSLLDQIPNA